MSAPTDFDADLNALLTKASAALDVDRPKEALALLQPRLDDFDGEQRDEAYRLALRALMLLERRAEFLRLFQRAMVANPRSALLLGLRAAADHNLGLYDQAIEFAEKSLALEPSNDVVHYVLASTLLRRAKPDLALAAIDKALKLAPDEADHHCLRAEILHIMERAPEAAAAVDAALALDPALDRALHLKSQMTPRRFDVMRLLRQALRLAPGNETYQSELRQARYGRPLLYALLAATCLAALGARLWLDPETYRLVHNRGGIALCFVLAIFASRNWPLTTGYLGFLLAVGSWDKAVADYAAGQYRHIVYGALGITIISFLAMAFARLFRVQAESLWAVADGFVYSVRSLRAAGALGEKIRELRRRPSLYGHALVVVLAWAMPMAAVFKQPLLLPGGLLGLLGLFAAKRFRKPWFFVFQALFFLLQVYFVFALLHNLGSTWLAAPLTLPVAGLCYTVLVLGYELECRSVVQPRGAE